MRKIIILILITLTNISFSHVSFCQVKKEISFKITGTIVCNSTLTKEITLVTQTKEIQDTAKVSANNFEFIGKVSEPTNAAIIVNGKMIKFPLVNDDIEIKILNTDNNEFEIQFKNSQVNNNLQAYYKKESKEYFDKYKLFEEQIVRCVNDDIKLEKQLSEDSLAINFIQLLVHKYKTTPDKSGLSIILSDLTGLIGTRNHPSEIKKLFKLLPFDEQNGYYGTEIKTYIERSSKILLGKKIDFDFIDINQKSYTINEFKGKLVLLEFWASWCGPCISQIPFLKQASKKKDKIQVISISIDTDFNKWRDKIADLEMDWINIHYKQEDNDLQENFFITGVPYNILISKNGEILRKNIAMAELLELLNQ